MSLEQELKDIAGGLWEDNSSPSIVYALYNIAMRVGDLEWRMDGLED